MDRRNGIGKLNCRLCGASYQMGIHNLHEPIDVFSEWLDDCEAAERLNGGTNGAGGGNGDSGGSGGGKGGGGVEEKRGGGKKGSQKLNTTSIGLDSDSEED